LQDREPVLEVLPGGSLTSLGLRPWKPREIVFT
jgi:hypothetical protein